MASEDTCLFLGVTPVSYAPNESRIAEIAWVLRNSSGETKRASHLISDHIQHLSAGVTAKTGITASLVRSKGEPIKDVLTYFNETLSANNVAFIVGFDIGFDLSLINVAMFQNNFSPSFPQFVDYSSVPLEGHPKSESRSLEALFLRVFGQHLPDIRRALEDADAVAAIASRIELWEVASAGIRSKDFFRQAVKLTAAQGLLLEVTYQTEADLRPFRLNPIEVERNRYLWAVDVEHLARKRFLLERIRSWRVLSQGSTSQEIPAGPM